MAAHVPFPWLGWDLLADSGTVPAGWVPLDLLFLSLLMVPVFLTGFLSFFLENTVSGEGLPWMLCICPALRTASAHGANHQLCLQAVLLRVLGLGGG